MQRLLSFQNLSSNVDLLIRERVSPGLNHFAIKFRRGVTWRNLLEVWPAALGNETPLPAEASALSSSTTCRS